MCCGPCDRGFGRVTVCLYDAAWRWDSPFNRPSWADGPYSRADVGERERRGVSDDQNEAFVDALHGRMPRRRFGGRAEPDVLVAIALGGALGTPARYEVSQLIHVAKDTFPWATFVVNLSGAFVLGLFLTLIERFPPTRYLRAFFAIGFLGSFTTFSTMAVDTVVLVKDHRTVLGIGYLGASVAAGLASCYLGMVLAVSPRLGRDAAAR